MLIIKKMWGGLLFGIGFILSPLSWWNDLFVNIPLAYGFGYLFKLIDGRLFLPMFILGYWLTNILGFILFRQGLVHLKPTDKFKYLEKQSLKKEIFVSVVFTLIVLIIALLGWLDVPIEYMDGVIRQTASSILSIF